MSKILILFAHPRTDRSEVNRPLLSAARSIAGVSVVDLYAEYPMLDIDIDREQRRLLDHDIVILQHPLYWYSSPAVLKEWQDLVLEHGFAYGRDGRALSGKIAFNAVTCGAQREAYTAQGANGAELRDLLAPFEKTFQLCRMRYLAPFALFGAGRACDDGRLDAHVDDYRELLSALVEDRLDLDAAQTALTLSDDLNGFVTQQEMV
ncbi:MAG: NAD(P)H-dependent oxidoreductase [Myxococcota bacterium]